MSAHRLTAMRRGFQQRCTRLVPAPAVPPDPIRTTAVRGYGQALAFYLLTLGAFAVTAVLDGAAAWGLHPGWAAVGDRWQSLALWGTLAVLTVWFAAVMRCRLVWVWAAGVVALIIVDAVVTGGAMRTPDGLYDVVAATLATLLAITLARRHGLSLTDFGFGHGRGRQDYTGRRQTYRVFWWSAIGCIASSATGYAIIALGLPYGHNPIHAHENPVGVVLRMVGASVTEEVMVAVVVITLSAARRPAWQMYTLAEVIRVSYHMYYQAVGPSVLVMGVVNVWLYRRTRRLAPIICAHIITDVMAYTISLGVVARVITAVVVCLAIGLVTELWLKPPTDTDTDTEGPTPDVPPLPAASDLPATGHARTVEDRA